MTEEIIKLVSQNKRNILLTRAKDLLNNDNNPLRDRNIFTAFIQHFRDGPTATSESTKSNNSNPKKSSARNSNNLNRRNRPVGNNKQNTNQFQ